MGYCWRLCCGNHRHIARGWRETHWIPRVKYRHEDWQEAYRAIDKAEDDASAAIAAIKTLSSKSIDAAHPRSAASAVSVPVLDPEVFSEFLFNLWQCVDDSHSIIFNNSPCWRVCDGTRSEVGGGCAIGVGRVHISIGWRDSEGVINSCEYPIFNWQTHSVIPVCLQQFAIVSGVTASQACRTISIISSKLILYMSCSPASSISTARMQNDFR